MLPLVELCNERSRDTLRGFWQRVPFIIQIALALSSCLGKTVFNFVVVMNRANKDTITPIYVFRRNHVRGNVHIRKCWQLFNRGKRHAERSKRSFFLLGLFHWFIKDLKNILVIDSHSIISRKRFSCDSVVNCVFPIWYSFLQYLLVTEFIMHIDAFQAPRSMIAFDALISRVYNNFFRYERASLSEAESMCAETFTELGESLFMRKGIYPAGRKSRWASLQVRH